MHNQRGLNQYFAQLIITLSLAIVSGCEQQKPQAPSPADVQVVNVSQHDVPLNREWVGSLDGSINAQIHAQVSGYIIKQDYKEGEVVKQGDILFEIDPRPFKASLAQANGALAQARALLGKATQDVERYTPLVKDKAISQEELDDAIQARLIALAQVQSAQAALDLAKLNLAFSHITSPITGVAGLIRSQIGDLVGPNTGTLTTVSTIDPIKVFFPLTEQDYLALKTASGSKNVISTDQQFDLILTDGTTYPIKGTFYALDNQIDVNTGTLKAVVQFPNPQGLLRPGQYGKVRATIGVHKNALCVPSRSLTELQGSYQLATVDSTNKTHITTVTIGPEYGNEVVIESGIQAGDHIILDGIQKIKDGAVVNPVPVTKAK
jgi:membrane fusion protein, multidrug efflux system